MKKCFLLLLFLNLACGTNDDSNSDNTIEVQVSEITDNGATLHWTVPSNAQPDISVVYKVILSGEIIADNLTARTYTFTGLNENRSYNGSIFALDSNGNETFTDFSFTTLKNPIFNGALVLNTQEQVDNFYYTSVLGITIEGENITNLDGLESLEFVHHFIIINNTSLETLEGLQNVQTDNNYSQQLTRLIIDSNSQLEDISQLSDFTKKCKLLEISDCPILTSLDGLELAENMSFRFENIGINNLNAFVNTEKINRLAIDGLNNITSLAGLESVQELLVLNIIGCQNLSSLNGMGTLDRITGFGLIDNDLIVSLDGLSFSNTSDSMAVAIRDNNNLSDFCAISEWVENNYLIIYNDTLGPEYHVSGNAYNPSLEEITDSEQCSQ